MSERRDVARAGAPAMVSPPVSRRLEAAILDSAPVKFAGGDPSEAPFVLPPRPASPDLRREAADVLALMQAGPKITVGAMEAWLKPLKLALPNSPELQDLPGIAAVFAVACDDLPYGALNAASQRAALASLRFWPSPAEVRRLLEAEAVDWRERMQGLERVANSPTASASTGASAAGDRPQPTEAERAMVAALVGAYRAEVVERVAAEKRPEGRVKPSYLSRGQLATEYRRLAEGTSDRVLKAGYEMRLETLEHPEHRAEQ